MSFEALEAGGRLWGGPVFWAYMAWTYALVLGGTLLYLKTARRMVASDERQRGVLLASRSGVCEQNALRDVDVAQLVLRRFR
jgi:hypothetical protein